MKVLYLFFTFCFSCNVLAQKEIISPTPQSFFSNSSVNVKPEFPGGMAEFHAYIAKRYQMPADSDEISGRIIVSFVIDLDGSVVDIKVIRDLGYGTGKEAIRVLKNSPKWSPGEKDGEKVRVLYTVPIAIGSKL